jgi:hypothetical protein
LSAVPEFSGLEVVGVAVLGTHAEIVVVDQIPDLAGRNKKCGR